jgi:predicted SAM-dependent methyltransferase
MKRLAQAARLRLRDKIRSLPPRREATRDDLAFRYLRGEGIEIGALYWPQRLPPGASARYVDYAPEEVLRTLDPAHPWVHPVDVIDDAQRLAKFEDESVDFVIAHHVIEHLEDPVAALEAFLRVLRPDGIAFITIPHARHTFDAARERTTVAHVLRDHREGPETSRRGHYEEWARFIDGITDPDVLAARVAEYAAQDYRHHLHVWEPESFLELLLALRLPAPIEAMIATGEEFSVILRKGSVEPDRRR